MRLNKYIVLVAAMIVLASCGTKKAIVTPETELTWHTCLIQGARATITHDGDSYSASITMQTVRDSMLTISIMPVLGIEALRLEATPEQVIAIDKLHSQYAQAKWSDLSRQLTPSISWKILQQLCSAELPTGSERARLQYAIGDQVIELIIDYPERKTDVPVRVFHQRIDRYNEIDISKWL